MSCDGHLKGHVHGAPPKTYGARHKGCMFSLKFMNFSTSNPRNVKSKDLVKEGKNV